MEMEEGKTTHNILLYHCFIIPAFLSSPKSANPLDGGGGGELNSNFCNSQDYWERIHTEESPQQLNVQIQRILRKRERLLQRKRDKWRKYSVRPTKLFWLSLWMELIEFFHGTVANLFSGISGPFNLRSPRRRKSLIVDFREMKEDSWAPPRSRSHILFTRSLPTPLSSSPPEQPTTDQWAM